MARPKKNNADYFSHDADMRNDPKVKALRRKFGFIGYAIWNMLLETLTDSDFFEFQWTDLNIELLAGDYDIDPDHLKEIVQYCITVKLLQEKDGVIYSKKMKDRFDGLLSKRQRDRNDTKPSKPSAKTPNKKVSVSENPQSKVKESKVKEKKDNHSNDYSNSPPEEKIIDNSKYVKEAKDSPVWLEGVAMNSKVSPDTVKVFLDQFEDHLKIMLEQKRTEKDFKQHFVFWLKKQDLSALRTKPVGRSNQVNYGPR